LFERVAVQFHGVADGCGAKGIDAFSPEEDVILADDIASTEDPT